MFSTAYITTVYKKSEHLIILLLSYLATLVLYCKIYKLFIHISFDSQWSHGVRFFNGILCDSQLSA